MRQADFSVVPCFGTFGPGLLHGCPDALLLKTLFTRRARSLRLHPRLVFVQGSAKQLGKPQIARLLHQTLEEEKQTDELLTQLAEASINKAAMTA